MLSSRIQDKESNDFVKLPSDPEPTLDKLCYQSLNAPHLVLFILGDLLSFQ